MFSFVFLLATTSAERLRQLRSYEATRLDEAVNSGSGLDKVIHPAGAVNSTSGLANQTSGAVNSTSGLYTVIHPAGANSTSGRSTATLPYESANSALGRADRNMVDGSRIPNPVEDMVRRFHAENNVLMKMEYFGTLVSCAGKTYLFTRVQMIKDGFITQQPRNKYPHVWMTRVRSVNEEGEALSDFVYLSFTEMSHNLAALCKDPSGKSDELVLMGGQRRTREGANWLGIYQTTVVPSAHTRRLDAFQELKNPSLLLDKNMIKAMNCYEHPYMQREGCGFDGKFHLMRWKGKVLLYARANLAYATEGDTSYRWVQVTTSDDHDLTKWSRFKLINMTNVPKVKDRRRDDVSLYFLTTTAWTDDKLLGAFPGCIRLRCGVFLTWSANGLDWTSPVQVSQQISPDGIHVGLHPVGFLNDRLIIMQRTEDQSERFFASQKLSNLVGILEDIKPRKEDFFLDECLAEEKKEKEEKRRREKEAKKKNISESEGNNSGLALRDQEQALSPAWRQRLERERAEQPCAKMGGSSHECHDWCVTHQCGNKPENWQPENFTYPLFELNLTSIWNNNKSANGIWRTKAQSNSFQKLAVRELEPGDEYDEDWMN